MEVSINQSSPSYDLQRAILLYGTSPSSIGLVTLHDIERAPLGSIIKEGIPATKTGLIAVLDSLNEEIRRPLQLMHPHVLAQNDDCMVWWEPAQMRRVVFDNQELGKRAAVVPHPALVFATGPAGWHVFALAKNERPTADTLLHVSPYFNVWATGKICVGSTSTPRGNRIWDPGAWSTAFFQSAFTHPNIHEKNRLVRHKFGPFAFWRDMLDGKYEAFPDVLVRTDATLGKLLQALTKGNTNA